MIGFIIKLCQIDREIFEKEMMIQKSVAGIKVLRRSSFLFFDLAVIQHILNNSGGVFFPNVKEFSRFVEIGK